LHRQEAQRTEAYASPLRSAAALLDSLLSILLAHCNNQKRYRPARLIVIFFDQEMDGESRILPKS
jgi:hypothetical protein